MPLTAEQCRAARGLLDWTQEYLAEQTGLGASTIKNFEAERSTPHKANRQLIRETFEDAGVEFIDRDNGGPGVRLGS